jgi:hypothetical protein
MQDFYTVREMPCLGLVKRGNNANALSRQMSARSALVRIGVDAIRSANREQESSGVKG